MDLDDTPRPSDDPLRAVETQALETLSRSDLADRVDRLKAEIVRTEAMLTKKGASQAAAEALFR
ncbi:MAG: DUF1192 family protein [Rhodothalassiaceae bacterium]